MVYLSIISIYRDTACECSLRASPLFALYGRRFTTSMAAVEEKKGEAKEIEHVNPVPEEMSLPSAAIQRIIKSKLPEGVMIGKEAKVAFSKASSIFILYVTTMCASAPPAPRVVRLVVSAAPPH